MLDENVKRITPAAVQSVAVDIDYLSSFVESLNNPILMQNLDELTQTVSLMKTGSVEEFFDIAQRNKKYGNVDPMKGTILIEKYDLPTPIPECTCWLVFRASDETGEIPT